MEFLNKILIGDAREQLKNLPDKCVNTCVTSPPYYGLRDYGTATWVGGDASCDHKGNPFRTKENVNRNTRTGKDKKNKDDAQFFKSICEKCGALRVDKQIGLEETPAGYVAVLVGLFKEVSRVLRDDGTLWLNLGDSYNSASSNQNSRKEYGSTINNAGYYTNGDVEVGRKKKISSLKEKDLIGIPWMVAFALRDAGWYLRQDIIWHKPNPMPESVTDRCTKSHEYMFLFSKKLKYYFDYQSIRSEAKNPSDDTRRVLQQRAENKSNPDALKNGLRPKEAGDVHADTAGANKRSVWVETTAPFPEAHFATYPPNLIVPCILAGCPEGGVVLDLFFGAGTTGVVAKKLHRNFIGIELNPKYASMAEKRLGKELGMFRWNKEVNVERSVATDVK